MSGTAITFTPDGRGHGIYTEALDLAALGRLHVERATEIKFCNERGLWRVHDMTGFPMFTAPTRGQCLEWERLYLQSQEDMKHGGLRERPAAVTGAVSPKEVTA